MTTDGRVKILAFGVAKLTHAEPVAGATATASTETADGLAVGTVGYMSPEQVRGHAVDARSDIFALGTVVYEMQSGRRAFGGDTPVDTMTAILTKDPEELSRPGLSVPAGGVARDGTLTRYPLQGGEPQPMTARLPPGTTALRASGDGRFVFVGRVGMPYRVDRLKIATGRLTPWRALRPDDLTGATQIFAPALSADGSAYAYTYGRYFQDLYLVEGLRY